MAPGGNNGTIRGWREEKGGSGGRREEMTEEEGSEKKSEIHAEARGR